MSEKNNELATIPNTEVHLLPSTYVDQTYKILVAKPKNYPESTDAYPTLYVLDANWHFGLVTQLLRTMQIYGELPEILVVGIAYPTEIEGDLWALRARDYTPTEDKEWPASFTETYGLPLTELPQASGGSSDFLSFIRHELVPLIDSKYRVDAQDRAIAGWSLGGLCALHALFDEPDLFSRYMILSPSIWWDDKIILTYEEEFAANSSRLPVKLFFSVGDQEGAMITNMALLLDIIEKRNYRALDLTKLLLENETHWTVVANSYSRGVRAVFD